MFQNVKLIIKVFAATFILFSFLQVFSNFTQQPTRRHPRLFNGVFDECATFNFDPMQWTMYWKSPYIEANETKECQELYHIIFQEKAVKQILYPNGKRRNLGCTRHTSECTEGPHFDYDRNVRINFPPCCLNHTLTMLSILTTDFNKHNIPHVLIGGAVLGWSRNRKWVPYDHDIDVWVDGAYFNTPLFNQLRRNWTSKHGYVTSVKDEGGKLWVETSKTNKNGIDLWAWTIDEDQRMVRMIEKFGTKWSYPYNVMFPAKRVDFQGVDTYIPNEAELYCDIKYGSKWREELKCTKRTNSRKCLR